MIDKRIQMGFLRNADDRFFLMFVEFRLRKTLYESLGARRAKGID